MAEEKIYLNGIGVKEIKFKNGGSIHKLNIRFEPFVEALRPYVNEKGYVNVVISPRKTVGKHGESHTMFIDLWKPSGDRPSNSATVSAARHEELNGPAPTSAPGDDNLPF
jgi:hypothetical protein